MKNTEFDEIPVGEAYRLQNAGGLVLVCTKGLGFSDAVAGSPHDEPDPAETLEPRYDLAPVAWCCPLDYAPVSKMLAVLDTGHRTLEDIETTGEFALAFPTAEQKELVLRTGSCSGRLQDKYATFDIPFRKAGLVDIRIPLGVSGWIECRLVRILREGTSAVVIGEVVAARALGDAWKRRVHYVADDTWYLPGERIG